MSVQKVLGCGVVAAVLLPLAVALFVVIAILAFIQSMPGADLAAAATDHFIGRDGEAPVTWRPPPLRPPGDITSVLLPYEPYIQSACARYGVNPHLVRAVIMQESGGDPYATSPAGAAGLMQLMPGTFAGLGYDPAWIHEPGRNIEAGVRYLALSLAAFDGDVYWAAAGYNAGIAGARWLKEEYGYVPASFAGGETLRYMNAILALMAEE